MLRRAMTACLLLAGCASQPTQLAPEAGCGPVPAPVPVDFSAWTAGRPLQSVRGRAELTAATFTPGQAIDLKLHRDGDVTYLTLLKGAGEAASFGGLARLRVGRAGTYAVGQGGFAWVDLVRDGAPIGPVSFGHGPACTGIRKVVKFPLLAGDYTLEVSGGQSPLLRVFVAGPNS